MQVRLSSGNYDVIASNDVFLFGDNNELVLHIDDDDGTQSRMVLRFIEDLEEKRSLKIEPRGDYELVINCLNFFRGMGAGLKEPILVGESMGKDVYILFSTKRHSAMPPYVRSVHFTLFREK
ncbi:MAG: hypothetical protein IKU31_00265 [Oscillospiraceae bacterium]|nr:hypothetical protein [Oscillospiraceae bacterium]